jgi:hypothetical protein
LLTRHLENGVGDRAAVLDCDVVIERVLRVAKSFEEAREMDREDVAALSFEESGGEIVWAVDSSGNVWYAH